MPISDKTSLKSSVSVPGALDKVRAAHFYSKLTHAGAWMSADAASCAAQIIDEDSCASMFADAASCAPGIMSEDSCASLPAAAASCASRIIDEDSCASLFADAARPLVPRGSLTRTLAPRCLLTRPRVPCKSLQRTLAPHCLLTRPLMPELADHRRGLARLEVMRHAYARLHTES